MNTTIQKSHTTSEYYSPWDLLPTAEPKTVNPPIDYFYNNVAKHLIKDTVRIMNNGLPIDLLKVKTLEQEIDRILNEVQQKLNNNKYVQQCMQLHNNDLIAKYKNNQESKLKTYKHFLKPFKHNNMNHRSYFMFIFSKEQQITQPTELLPTGVPKWSNKLVKKLSTTRPLLKKLLNNKLPDNHSIVKEAMKLLATHKANIYNYKYLEKINSPPINTVSFNPNSTIHKREFFSMLDIKSDSISKKTNESSWDREQIERVNKETTDPIVKEMTTALINHSFGANIKSTFIPAFYKYTVDNKLHGTLNLFGAKSFRYTSQNPNLLNAPSTRSIYAKPVKRCFIAPDDYLVYSVDLSALEDRVMASLSHDKNKCSVFLEGLDGHSLNAYEYFKNEITEYMKITDDINTDVKEFFRLVEEGHKELKAIRQKGKPATLTTKRPCSSNTTRQNSLNCWKLQLI